MPIFENCKKVLYHSTLVFTLIEWCHHLLYDLKLSFIQRIGLVLYVLKSKYWISMLFMLMQAVFRIRIRFIRIRIWPKMLICTDPVPGPVSNPDFFITLPEFLNIYLKVITVICYKKRIFSKEQYHSLMPKRAIWNMYTGIFQFTNALFVQYSL